MISANGGLPAHRYTLQVTPRWPRGSEPASLAVPLGTSTAAGKQYKAQEALLPSLGTGSSQFISFWAKTSNSSEQGPSGPPLKVKA